MTRRPDRRPPRPAALRQSPSRQDAAAHRVAPPDHFAESAWPSAEPTTEEPVSDSSGECRETPQRREPLSFAAEQPWRHHTDRRITKCADHLTNGSPVENHIGIEDKQRGVFTSPPPADVYPARIPEVGPGRHASNIRVSARKLDGLV